MKTIAIIGAGLCGLATAWHLAQNSEMQITLFDAKGIGGGASGVAAGLLHTYAGAHAKLNWRGEEGFSAASLLLDKVEKKLGYPVTQRTGLRRLAFTEKQLQDFNLCASRYQDVHWQEGNPPSIFIESAMTVDCPLYLKGLWTLCADLGVSLEKKKIARLEDLTGFDSIVIAAGAESGRLAGLARREVTPVKGQIIELSWPDGVPKLTFPLNSQAYILMSATNNSCIAGATFEKIFESSDPDVEVAKKDLFPKYTLVCPFLRDATILDCRAGIRVSTPDHRPLCKRISEKCWILTGMGSKGLLYHALFAKELCKQIARSV